MAPVPAATRPIIVCGMARAGTSLVGQLVRTADDVVIFPEMSPNVVPSMFDLVSEVRSTLSGQSWRGFAAEDVDARVVELLRRIWGAGRDSGRGDDVGQTRFGLKQPHAEEHVERFAEVLGDYRPLWVYAVRDSRALYRSNLLFFTDRNMKPKHFRTRFLRSVQTAHRVQEAGEMIVFDVDRATTDSSFREVLAAETLGFLGLQATERTSSFLERWPEVNRLRGENRGGLSDMEIERRLATFAKGEDFRKLTDTVAGLQRG